MCMGRMRNYESCAVTTTLQFHGPISRLEKFSTSWSSCARRRSSARARRSSSHGGDVHRWGRCRAVHPGFGAAADPRLAAARAAGFIGGGEPSGRRGSGRRGSEAGGRGDRVDHCGGGGRRDSYGDSHSELARLSGVLSRRAARRRRGGSKLLRRLVAPRRAREHGAGADVCALRPTSQRPAARGAH